MPPGEAAAEALTLDLPTTCSVPEAPFLRWGQTQHRPLRTGRRDGRGAALGPRVCHGGRAPKGWPPHSRGSPLPVPGPLGALFRVGLMEKQWEPLSSAPGGSPSSRAPRVCPLLRAGPELLESQATATRLVPGPGRTSLHPSRRPGQGPAGGGQRAPGDIWKRLEIRLIVTAGGLQDATRRTAPATSGHCPLW